MSRMEVRALTWNLFHGRDFPPDRALFTLRSRLLRVTERDDTHLQVNRDLFGEFTEVIDAADWHVALLQECPPRWAEALATVCAAEPHLVLTSRNSFAPLRTMLARLNPDLIASNEGGSNLTLVRGGWEIDDRRELVLRKGPDPERRAMAFSRLRHSAGARLCVANMHLSAGPSRRPLAEEELNLAADTAAEWADDEPLLLGGDLNIRPSDSPIYNELADRLGLRERTGPEALDHLLARGLEPIAPATPWPPSRRELRDDGGVIRLSDHSPVEATFEL
ncbi:MAG: endonuclease/exonuclease/phosphatase family protein [Solirubrobacterales bacterium]